MRQDSYLDFDPLDVAAEPRAYHPDLMGAQAVTKQVDIHSASFRVLDDTPGHARYGVWVNGGKCGDLTVRQEERVAFEEMMQRAGFLLSGFAADDPVLARLTPST